MAEEARGTARRGRPRLAETDRSIHDAALELIRTRGPEALSIDAVAARSGVARTTIYRRYRDRDELMAAVLDKLLDAELPPPRLPVADKLRWVLTRVLLVLEHGVGRGGIAAVLRNSDPAFTGALRARLGERLEALQHAMTVDAEGGRLGPGVDPDTLLGLLVGAYLSEALRYGEPREGWAERTVELLMTGVEAG